MTDQKTWRTFVLWGLVSAGLISICTAKLPDPPPQRSRGDIEAALAQVPQRSSVEVYEALNILLVADKKDHGPGEHDYPLWQQRWQVLLSGEGTGPTHMSGPRPAAGPSGEVGPVTAKTAQGWPDEAQLTWADVIIVFCYIDWDASKLAQLRTYLDNGGGFVPVHSATWTKPRPSAQVASLIGCGGFRQWRHGPLKLKLADPNHPICLGLPREIDFLDEAYWPPSPQGVTPAMQVLATSEEKPHKTSSTHQAQPMFWTYALGQGRVFGCVLGHYNWTFDDPYFRLLLLRGMAWSARQWPYRFDRLCSRGIALRD